MISAEKWPSLPRLSPRGVGWSVVGVLAILLVVTVSKALFVVFAGVLGAVFLHTIAAWIARRTRVPYRVVVVAVVLVAIAAWAFLLVLAGPSLVAQTDALLQALPRAAHDIVQRVRVELRGAGFPIAPPRPEQIAPEAKNVVAGATLAVTSSAEVVGALVVALFLTIYGAFNPQAYVQGALKLVRPERRARAAQIVHETGRRLGRWLVGRAVAMAFVGVATTIGLHLLGVPLAVILGIVAGVLAFVEYLGAVASAIPPILLALTEDPLHALWVVLLFLGVHIVEGYILTPLIARTAVRFPPAFTLAAQTLFGAVFGVVGLTFATPTCIVGTTLVEMLYVEDALGDRSVERQHPPPQ